MHCRRLAVSTLLTLLIARSASATPLLSVDPPNLTLNPGDTFSLDVSIANVSDLYGFQFDIGFDPQVLQVNDIIPGDFLLAGGPTFLVPGSIDNTAGMISLFGASLLLPGPGVDGSGTLATIDFLSLGPGVSPISFANPLTDLILFNSNGDSLDFTAVGGSVTATAPVPVPEPATLTVTLMGLGSVFVWRERRRPRKTIRQ